MANRGSASPCGSRGEDAAPASNLAAPPRPTASSSRRRLVPAPSASPSGLSRLLPAATPPAAAVSADEASHAARCNRYRTTSHASSSQHSDAAATGSGVADARAGPPASTWATSESVQPPTVASGSRAPSGEEETKSAAAPLEMRAPSACRICGNSACTIATPSRSTGSAGAATPSQAPSRRASALPVAAAASRNALQLTRDNVRTHGGAPAVVASPPRDKAACTRASHHMEFRSG
jgi:hypothetical protein